MPNKLQDEQLEKAAEWWNEEVRLFNGWVGKSKDETTTIDEIDTILH